MLKTTTPRNRLKYFSISPVPSYHYIFFSLTTSRRVANICDRVKKNENLVKRLHTSATFWSPLCDKRAYCEISRATNIYWLTGRNSTRALLLYFMRCSNLPPWNVYQLKASGVWILSSLAMQRLRLFTWLCLCWLFLCGSWPVIWPFVSFLFVCFVLTSIDWFFVHISFILLT